MKAVAGVLLLIAGVVFPMAMLFRMNSTLSRTPAPRPSQVGMLLALNAILPVALITAGLALLSARIATSPGVRVVMLATWLGSVVLLIVLAIGKNAGRRGRGDDGG